MSNVDSTKKQGVNTGASEGKAVPVSHKTPAVLLVVKFDKNLVDDRGEKIYVKGKRYIKSFEKWIFLISQPVREYDRRIFVAMTSS